MDFCDGKLFQIMKIVFICEAVFPENKGGVERWFNRLSQELASRGHEVVYLNAAGVDENRSGVQYRSITKHPWFYLPGGVRSKGQALSFGRAVFRELRSIDADSIYATSVPILSILPLALIRILKPRTTAFVEWFEIWPYKYWIFYSGYFSGSLGWLIQLLALQIGNYRIAYTERAVRDIYGKNFLQSKKNVRLLPGLCEPIFYPRQDENAIRTDVTFLGRFVDEKQPLLALDAVFKFIESGWTGNFWIIGKGPALEEIEQMLNRYPETRSQIQVLENVPDAIVREKLESSFALLHPSKREGYGLASVEAAYLGTPSILLNYPENATLDLEISPDLVVGIPNAKDIVTKLELAFREQLRLRQRTLEWAKNASLNKSIKSTADSIENLLGVINEQ